MKPVLYYREDHDGEVDLLLVLPDADSLGRLHCYGRLWSEQRPSYGPRWLYENVLQPPGYRKIKSAHARELNGRVHDVALAWTRDRLLRKPAANLDS